MNTPAYSNGEYPAGDGIPELPPAHVEAPVSANCRLVLEGHEVQVTVRSGATPHEVEVVMLTASSTARILSGTRRTAKCGTATRFNTRCRAAPLDAATSRRSKRDASGLAACLSRPLGFVDISILKRLAASKPPSRCCLTVGVGAADSDLGTGAIEWEGQCGESGGQGSSESEGGQAGGGSRQGEEGGGQEVGRR